jgi:hypothetical protein
MKASWNWYRNRSRFVKLVIIVTVLTIIGTVMDATDGKTSYESMKQGDCYSDTFSSANNLLISDFSKVDCSQSHLGRIVYVESFEGREFPISWEQYAEDNCPAISTHFYHSVDKAVMYEDIFICVVEGATDGGSDV